MKAMAREVLAGGLGARAVDEREGVVPLARKRQAVGERILHGANVRKAAAGAHDGHVRAGVAAEEVEPRVALGRVGAPLLLGVDVVEDPPSRGYVRAQAVDHVHRGLRVQLRVPGVAERSQRVAAPVPALGREQQPARRPQHRVVDHVCHTRV